MAAKRKIVLKLNRGDARKWKMAAAVAAKAKGTTGHSFDKDKGELTVQGEDIKVTELIKMIESGGSRRLPRFFRYLLFPFYLHRRVRVEDVVGVS